MDAHPKIVEHFREILLWPLKLEKIGTDADWLDECYKALDGSAWIAHKDLYNRRIASDDVTRYAEFVYFHPFVQRFLYGEKAQGQGSTPIALYRRDDVDKARVRLPHADGCDGPDNQCGCGGGSGNSMFIGSTSMSLTLA